MLRWLLIIMLTGMSNLFVHAQETIHIEPGYTWRQYNGTIPPLCNEGNLCHNYNMVGSLNSFYQEFAAWTGTSANQASGFMNFRVIFPPDYINDGSVKYPMIVMLHGAGESGRKWTGRYDYLQSQPEYDNNSNNLKHGGNEHKVAVLKPASDPRAFPGIVVFPQASYNGSWSDAWNNGIPTKNQEFVFGFIEHFIANYNADINRIATHGLSNGAKGVWDTAMKRPDLFSAVLPFSGVPFENDLSSDILLTTPIRLYQGGTDINPNPDASLGTINAFKAKGGNPEYFLYPTLGHNTWTTAFASADFFSWILAQDKRKIYVFGGSTGLCDVPGVTKKLGFSAGFLEYQWVKDDVDISGETTRYLTISSIGTYKVKFKRKDNQWYESLPVTITLQGESTFSPALTNTGSLILPFTKDNGNIVGSIGQTSTVLIAPPGFSQYTWYKNGSILETNTSNTRQLFSGSGSSTHAGEYAVSVKENTGCESLISNVKTVVYNPNALIANNPSGPWHSSPSGGTSAQGEFTGITTPVLTPISENKMQVTWTETVPDEEYFEIWRYRKADAIPIYPNQANYVVVGIVPPNTTTFIDQTGLRPLGEYTYRIRAIGNNDGRFSAEPNKKKTLDDFQAPLAPSDLQVTAVSSSTITVSWSAAKDNDVIYRYEVFLGPTSLGFSQINDLSGDNTDGNPAPSTSYTFTGLDPNTTYMLNVRAIDFRGNISPFPLAVSGTTSNAANGLAYKYYEGAGFGGALPNFNNLNAVETGTVTNITLAPRNRDTNYGMVFEGYINILDAGVHSFSTKSDDGSKLFIGTTYVVNNDGNHGAQTRSGNYNFPSPGLYAIRVEYGQGTGGFELSWEYDTPSELPQIIPNNRLFLAPPTITHYYSKSTGNLDDLSRWGTSTNGNGTQPPNFSSPNVYYHIANRTTTSLNNPWIVSGTSSRVIVENGVTLTLNDPLTGKLYLNAGSTVTVNTTTMPTFFDIDPSSTVNINVTGTVPNAVYGNLNLKTASTSKTLPHSSTIVKGDFIVDDQVLVEGNPVNQSTLSVAGNIIFNGNSGTPPATNNRYSVSLTGPNIHTISTNQFDLSLYSLQVENGGTAQFDFNSIEPFNISIGTPNGSGGLILGSGSQLLLGDNHLIVNGAGGINPNSEAGEISINGSNVTISTTALQNSNISFNSSDNLIENFTVGLGNSQLNVATPARVINLLTVNSGTLNLNSPLSLLSNESGTARINKLLNGARITGNVNFQRYMDGEGRIYRYISSPVKNGTVANLQQYVPVTGNFTGASVIGGGVTSGASMFHYSEPTYYNFPPNGGTNLDTLRRGKGYPIFIREANNASTWQLTGTPHQGNIAFTLTPGTASPNDGWNLLGNPYAAPIQWTGVQGTGWSTMSGVAQTVYVRENQGSLFWWRVYRPGIFVPGENQLMLTNGIIAPGQAFWVQTTNANPALTITENAKQTDDAVFYRQDEPEFNDVLEITLTNGTLKDLAYLMQDDNGTENYEKAEDAFKNPNSFFNLSTLSKDNVSLAINVTPESFCEKETRISITSATAGPYTLAVNGLENFKRIEKAYLIDKFLNTTTEITSGFTYPFNITSDPLSTGNNRFVITETPVFLSDLTLTGSAACGGDAYVTIEDPQPGMKYQAFKNGVAVSGKFSTESDNLQLLVNKEMLGMGEHSLTIIGGYDGCTVTLNQQPVVPIVPEISRDIQITHSDVCEEKTAITLSSPQADVSYQVLKGEVPVSDMVTTTEGDLFIQLNRDLLTIGGADSLRLIGSYNGCVTNTITDAIIVKTVESINRNLSLKGSDACEGNATLNIIKPQDGVFYQAVYNGSPVSDKQAAEDGAVQLTIDKTLIGFGSHAVKIIAEKGGCTAELYQEGNVLIDTLVTPEIVEKSGTLATNKENADTYQWYFEGSPIEGATTGSYLPSESGNYSVRVTSGLCSKESMPYKYIVTDVQMTGGYTLDSYPNPFNNRIVVRLPENIKGGTVTLHDLLGQTVNVKEIAPQKANEVELDYTGVSPGTYIIRLGLYRIKVIKQN